MKKDDLIHQMTQFINDVNLCALTDEGKTYFDMVQKEVDGLIDGTIEQYSEVSYVLLMIGTIDKLKSLEDIDRIYNKYKGFINKEWNELNLPFPIS